jgi:hypothetical protein
MSSAVAMLDKRRKGIAKNAFMIDFLRVSSLYDYYSMVI